MPEPLNKQSYSLVDFFEEDDYSESETYNEYTKLTRMNVARISHRVEQIKSDPAMLAMMARSWKSYPGATVTPLPPFRAPTVGFAETVLRRRSVSSLGRDFVGEAITAEQLGGTLVMAYGPTSKIESRTGDVQHLRATTSAGALFPTEIYVLAFNVTGIEPGLYHYRPIEHSLELIRSGDLRAQFAGLSSYQGLCLTSSVALVLTSVLKRTMSKYQHRGYRFAMYDCGALTQSLYLSGTAMGLDTCALGGIYDDEVAAFLGVNPVDEPVQLGFLLGPRGAEMGTEKQQ